MTACGWVSLGVGWWPDLHGAVGAARSLDTRLQLRARHSMDEAIAYGARSRGERRRPTAGRASLTPTEVEVVRLAGQHLSNPEIAARRLVSRATVKTHLVRIFARLGIDSRSQLVAEALRRGIQPQPNERR